MPQGRDETHVRLTRAGEVENRQIFLAFDGREELLQAVTRAGLGLPLAAAFLRSGCKDGEDASVRHRSFSKAQPFPNLQVRLTLRVARNGRSRSRRSGDT